MPHATYDPPAPWTGQQLYVNDGPLQPDQVGALRETTLDAPIEEIRRRYNEDGYVFLKQLLPRQDVLKAREQYFSLLQPSGCLKPGTRPVQGIFDSSKDHRDYPGIGAGGQDENGRPIGPNPEIASKFVDLALQAHNEDWYKETFCKHPALLKFVQDFTSWQDNTMAIKRTLLRNNTPGNKAIGVHYDQIFLRHGADTAVTAWVPLGDVKVTGGGLIYLEKGHTIGAEMEKDFTIKAKQTGFSDEEARNAFNANMMHGGMLHNGPAEFSRDFQRRWLVAANGYEAGDVVLHNAFAIHASTMNYDTEGVIRVGTDLRFVDSSKEWDKRWDKTYSFNDGV
ncbi:hypothetical protein M409DRAFT_68075 [Zasmidium cellare ATCC 36951]|uniref:Phytanoyl-CoA hydroxylase n=1 Tax=Zasmidium cellare ATCC 36951 TaxID=1080233 RepID=A0A6A6CEW1_ZASCE|nr:uncharacterized protein M409DRAFT_68075 [Zasmidium cellare ATCC 36951]KAF2164199.1 hypothetical protein M409DRAFT_68075 [Zasmidium cellare ATCC 36951]